MEYDVFFSISQTPVDGVTPSEADMLRAFFAEVEAADRLGFGCAWIAESHLSTQVQKRHSRPVVPHWKGEIGLNTDIFQLAHKVFGRTRRIDVGAAVMNLVCNGGPVARAEQLATFAALHGADAEEKRRLSIGFSAGRFDFMNRAYGIGPRDEVEREAWPALKGLVFREACEIFLRLLRGEAISSEETAPTVLTRDHFRTDEHWQRVQAAAAAAGRPTEAIPIARRWEFEVLKIIPQDFRRDVFDLVIGSHDPALQAYVNEFLPVKVFNLSITRPEIIESTHQRMAEQFHPDGGAWQRGFMPRTVMVFVNAEPGLSDAERSAAAHGEARAALSAYWTALEGTLDPAKVERAAENAVVGNPAEVAEQIAERFHPDDRLMLWFDFYKHDSDRVVADMTAFMEQVAPRVSALAAGHEA